MNSWRFVKDFSIENKIDLNFELYMEKATRKLINSMRIKLGNSLFYDPHVIIKIAFSWYIQNKTKIELMNIMEILKYCERQRDAINLYLQIRLSVYDDNYSYRTNTNKFLCIFLKGVKNIPENTSYIKRLALTNSNTSRLKVAKLYQSKQSSTLKKKYELLTGYVRCLHLFFLLT
ncbi:hypothetical protein MXB_3768, partial [Myxobolus squamalis]